MSTTTPVSAVALRLLRALSAAQTPCRRRWDRTGSPLFVPVSWRLVHKSVHKTDRLSQVIKAHQRANDLTAAQQDALGNWGRSEFPRLRYEPAEDSLNLRRQLKVGIAGLPGDDFLADAVAC